jgi:hypothetical protein
MLLNAQWDEEDVGNSSLIRDSTMCHHLKDCGHRRFIKELNIPHEVRVIDYKGGEHKEPWFLKVGILLFFIYGGWKA